MTKLLGQGGQGMVLLGEQDGRKEAIKIFTVRRCSRSHPRG